MKNTNTASDQPQPQQQPQSPNEPIAPKPDPAIRPEAGSDQSDTPTENAAEEGVPGVDIPVELDAHTTSDEEGDDTAAAIAAPAAIAAAPMGVGAEAAAIAAPADVAAVPVGAAAAADADEDEEAEDNSTTEAEESFFTASNGSLPERAVTTSTPRMPSEQVVPSPNSPEGQEPLDIVHEQPQPWAEQVEQDPLLNQPIPAPADLREPPNQPVPPQVVRLALPMQKQPAVHPNLPFQPNPPPVVRLQLQALPNQQLPPVPPRPEDEEDDDEYITAGQWLDRIVEWLRINPDVAEAFLTIRPDAASDLYGRELSHVVLDFMMDFLTETTRNLIDDDFLGVQVRVGWLPTPHLMYCEIRLRYNSLPGHNFPSYETFAADCRGLYSPPDRRAEPPQPNCLICYGRPHGFPVDSHWTAKCKYGQTVMSVAVMMKGITCIRCGKRTTERAGHQHSCQKPTDCHRHQPPRQHAPWTLLCNTAEGTEEQEKEQNEEDVNRHLASLDYVGFPLDSDRHHRFRSFRGPYPGLMSESCRSLTLPPNHLQIIKMEPRLKRLVEVMKRDMNQPIPEEEINHMADQLDQEIRRKEAEEENRRRNEAVAIANQHRAAERARGHQINPIPNQADIHPRPQEFSPENRADLLRPRPQAVRPGPPAAPAIGEDIADLPAEAAPGNHPEQPGQDD